MIKDYGYIESIPDYSADYFSGTLPKVIINPSGDWRPFCTTYEPQFGSGFDTNDCTVFGNENSITVLIKQMFSIDKNYSERFISNMMNDTFTGLDPHSVLEMMRHNGMLDQEKLPFPSTLVEYATPRPIPQSLQDEALNWGYDLKHEYVFTNNPSRDIRLALMREHLKYSPLPCSVTAWQQDENGLYVDNGLPNTHWVVCVYIDENDVMYMYDSYDLIVNGISTALIKKLHPDHHIQQCKRLYISALEKKTELTWIQKMLNWIAEQLNLIDTQVKKKPMPDQPISEVVPLVVPETITQKYWWDIKENCRHSVRTICDEENLSVADKNDLCATIGAESNWNPKAIGEPNYNGTRDYGIVQVNTKYWIGPGKLFPTTDYVLNNPEECVRWMIKEWKAGNKNWWYGYKNGSYKKFL